MYFFMFLCSPADVSRTSGRTEAQEERGGSEERQSGDQRTSRCPDAAALWIVRRLVHRCRCLCRTHQGIQAPEGSLNVMMLNLAISVLLSFLSCFGVADLLPSLNLFIEMHLLSNFSSGGEVAHQLGKPIPSTEPVFVSSAPAAVTMTTSKTAATTTPTPTSVVQKKPAVALSKTVASLAKKPATAKVAIFGKWPYRAFSLNKHNECLCKSFRILFCSHLRCLHWRLCEFIIHLFAVAILYVMI